MIARSLALLAFVTSAATFARADTLVVTASSPGLPVGATVTVPVARFDPALGTLSLVRVYVNLRPYGSVGIENTTGAPIDASGGQFGIHIPYWNTLNASYRIPGATGDAHAGVGCDFPGTYFSAYDGVTDFAGTSGATHTAVGGGDDGYTGMLPVTGPHQFEVLAGPGTVGIEVGPLIHNAYWSGGLPPAWCVTQSWGWNAIVELSVEYNYVPHPTQLCTLPFGFAGCPCDGFASGAGCPNSANANGALLQTSGTPSIANDTLTLSGTRMTNSSALYFQGTAFHHEPSVYGDGLRCVVGTVVRLGTRTNVAGASAVPGAGGTPVSVVGGVSAPGTRHYQIVYRDNGNFCAPSNFNAANGVSVVWAP